MNIGVAIVTYNNSQDIAACITSLRQEGLQDIVVVDSCSSDNTVQEITTAGCRYIVLDTNRGFGYAANKAAHMLNTEYVLFINPDARLLAGSRARLAQTIQDHPSAGIIGMLLVDSSGVPEAMAYGDEPNLFRMISRHFYRKKRPSNPFTVDWVSGGAFIIQKKLFDDLGGFDEQFFMYWEDVDLSKRVREKGRAVLLDPNAKVTHARGGSSLGDQVKNKIYDQSADRYYKKHYSSTIWCLQRFLRKVYRAYIA